MFCEFSSFNRYIFYDVNPGEGFNLRRDVFMRMAVMVKKLNDHSQKFSYTLVRRYISLYYYYITVGKTPTF